MNKCPYCGSPVGALVKFCDACCKELPAQESAAVSNLSGNDVTPVLGAAELCEKLQEDIAALATRPPTPKSTSFLVGLFTTPTLGLAFIAYKAVQIFGGTGNPGGRIMLSIDEKMRKAQTAYGADPTVSALIKKSKLEMDAYHKNAHSSRMSFLTGAATSAAILIIAVVAFSLSVKHKQDQTLSVISTALANVQSGNLEGAIASLMSVPEKERAKIAQKEPILMIALFIIKGDNRQALDLTKTITNNESREKAETYVAQKLFDQNFNAGNLDEALKSASYMHPEAVRVAASEKVEEKQAMGFIDQNKMDEAMKILANIQNPELKTKLNGLIQEKLPKANLNGF